MAEHPYRPELARVDGRRVALAEAERPPQYVRVRAWNDGTMRMRLGVAKHFALRITFGVLAGSLGMLALILGPLDMGFLFSLLALSCAVIVAGVSGGERISVSPAAIARRRRFGRGEVRALGDVSTVGVSGNGAATRVALQLGRERLPLAEGLGYDEPTLRWIAQRLRRAIEAAR